MGPTVGFDDTISIKKPIGFNLTNKIASFIKWLGDASNYSKTAWDTVPFISGV
jgi:hypothetical protein